MAAARAVTVLVHGLWTHGLLMVPQRRYLASAGIEAVCYSYPSVRLTLTDNADRLAAFARELPSKVNIIPYNPVPGLDYKRPTPAAIEAFAERLYPHAPAVTVRQTQGGDIWAACGQLGGLSDPE